MLILALAAAVLYGTADFLGGVASRRASALAVMAVTMPAGAVVVLAAALAGATFAGGILPATSFGAWQGMGLCQLHVGDVEGACKSFRAALKINPHDRGLRRMLQQCEELLRKLSPERSETPDWV